MSWPSLRRRLLERQKAVERGERGRVEGSGAGGGGALMVVVVMAVVVTMVGMAVVALGTVEMAQGVNSMGKGARRRRRREGGGVGNMGKNRGRG